MDRALTVAEEYRRLVERGDVVLAEQARRTIDELCGRWVDGTWTYPANVVLAMGGGEPVARH